MRIVLGLAVMSLALLGGCRSEEQSRAAVRELMLKECTGGMTPELKASGIDGQRYCECFADGALKGRSVAEIERIEKDPAETDRVGGQVAKECIAQQRPAVAATPPAAPATAEPTTEDAATEDAATEETEATE
jgi:hypothetical protein